MYKNHGIKPFEKKVWLSSPTMHGDELRYITEAYETNWMSTVGQNIDETEKILTNYTGAKYAVALSTGTASLHLSLRLAAEKAYGKSASSQGLLSGKKVFCSDLTFSASVNCVVYEGGEPVFIDTERDSWNMSPEALSRAFELYPDVKIVVLVHLYGTPAKLDEIKKIIKAHDAILIEDAAEALGATYNEIPAGSFGDFNTISFNGNKIITGTSGSVFLTNDKSAAAKVRKWSTQSREAAPWYQHEELGYNYRMSNIIAGVIRGQFSYLEEHIAQKKAIYERYAEGLKNLPVTMNPVPENCKPNYWLSCLLIDKAVMCRQLRTETEYSYTAEKQKSCPQEIFDAIRGINAECRPIWKPMHAQPIYSSNAFIAAQKGEDVSMDIFNSGLCLPSDNKMTAEQQEIIVETIKACFE